MNSKKARKGANVVDDILRYVAARETLETAAGVALLTAFLWPGTVGNEEASDGHDGLVVVSWQDEAI